MLPEWHDDVHSELDRVDASAVDGESLDNADVAFLYLLLSAQYRGYDSERHVPEEYDLGCDIAGRALELETKYDDLSWFGIFLCFDTYADSASDELREWTGGDRDSIENDGEMKHMSEFGPGTPTELALMRLDEEIRKVLKDEVDFDESDADKTVQMMLKSHYRLFAGRAERDINFTARHELTVEVGDIIDGYVEDEGMDWFHVGQTLAILRSWAEMKVQMQLDVDA